MSSNTKTMMNSGVRDSAVAEDSTLESNSCLPCIILRTVIDFDVIHIGISYSLLQVAFNKITSNNLATPGIGVVTLNLNISRKKHYLTSHINTIILRTS